MLASHQVQCAHLCHLFVQSLRRIAKSSAVKVHVEEMMDDDGGD